MGLRSAGERLAIRIALGAEPGRVVRMMVKEGLVLVVTGLAIGLVGSLVLTRWIASQLYGVGARDPVTFVGVGALLGLVALAAVWAPSRRAARVDPMAALRLE
jgi:putative ABC transport system permease protein